MAKALPSDARPKTSGTSSSIAVASRLPTMSVLRTAGYQKSQRKPRSSSLPGSPAAAPFPCKMVRVASLISSFRIVLPWRASKIPWGGACCACDQGARFSLASSGHPSTRQRISATAPRRHHQNLLCYIRDASIRVRSGESVFPGSEQGRRSQQDQAPGRDIPRLLFCLRHHRAGSRAGRAPVRIPLARNHRGPHCLRRGSVLRDFASACSVSNYRG